jgi:thymidylate synthase (FAD)
MTDKTLCLDKGFVRLVDQMGDDAAIVQAARVSYGAGTKKLSEDRGLIRYLMRHRHTTPFEMCEIKFHIKAPIFVARQWLRHRTANVNELSLRYSEASNEAYVPDEIGQQSVVNKQARGDNMGVLMTMQAVLAIEDGNLTATQTYNNLLAHGVSREQARIVLPLSTYTEWYWKIDLHNLLHFLELRLSPKAQPEITEYARAMAGYVKRWCPLAWEAFEDYRLEAYTLSRAELEIIKGVMRSQYLPANRFAHMSERERTDFIAKFDCVPELVHVNDNKVVQLS